MREQRTGAREWAHNTLETAPHPAVPAGHTLAIVPQEVSLQMVLLPHFTTALATGVLALAEMERVLDQLPCYLAVGAARLIHPKRTLSPTRLMFPTQPVDRRPVISPVKLRPWRTSTKISVQQTPVLGPAMVAQPHADHRDYNRAKFAATSLTQR